ncbi:MAG TPA: hypothetical protein VGJ97_08575 [Anaerolineaceae bacterium]|jgi:hypothetical protein
MAKKQKRQVSTATARPEVTPFYTPAAAARRLNPVAEFKPDYTHVIADLKRIGVLAGSFLVILVVLSFILH